MVTPYEFTFNLSKAPHFFFTELELLSYQRGMHKTFLNRANEPIIKFRIQEPTGLKIADGVVLLGDFIDLQVINTIEKSRFCKQKSGCFPATLQSKIYG